MVYDYLPRIWTESGYYYPCFSELGLTYENPDLEFNEDNVKDLRFAYSWILDADKGIYFKHIVERCSGIKDKHDKLIYEGDIITKLYVTPTGELTKDLDTDFVYEVKFKYGAFGVETKTKFIPLQEFLIKSEGEYISNAGNKVIYGRSTLAIVGNIHQNASILEKVK